MTLTQTSVRDVEIVHIEGCLDAQTAPNLEAVVQFALDAGVRKLLLDCQGMNYVSSMGLRVFMVAGKLLASRDGVLAFGQRCIFVGEAREELRQAGHFKDHLPGYQKYLLVHGFVTEAGTFSILPASAASRLTASSLVSCPNLRRKTALAQDGLLRRLHSSLVWYNFWVLGQVAEITLIGSPVVRRLRADSDFLHGFALSMDRSNTEE